MRSYEVVSNNMSMNLKLDLKPGPKLSSLREQGCVECRLQDYIRDVLEEHAGKGEATLSETATSEEWRRLSTNSFTTRRSRIFRGQSTTAERVFTANVKTPSYELPHRYECISPAGTTKKPGSAGKPVEL